MVKRSSDASPGPVAPAVDAALSAAVGPALVLDRDLRVRLATHAAEALLGMTVPLGASAPSLLCGSRPERPVAEALLAGLAFSATIPRPGDDGSGATLRVRSTPLGNPSASLGWLLTFDPGVSEDRDDEERFGGMWSRDPAMRRMFRLIERVAADESSVLVRGETGAGKELVARALHDCSSRRAGPFRAINCAALPSNLLESELFGHLRGAFTGAVRDTPGHFQLANKGTLFLDEVAELPLELQAKLLRVLETRAITPVGGRDPIAIDVRIVSATHRALRGEVAAGRFRADLMYRLRVIPIFLPPLRERVADVALLVDRIVEEYNARGRRRVERVSPATLRALEAYEWPGNVRELRNVLAYAFAVGEGTDLLPSHLPPEVLEASEEGRTVPVVAAPASPPPDPKLDPEARRIVRALERSGGSRAQAAKLLGVSRITLWRRMKEHGLATEGVSGDVSSS
jgi:transcriptional regulator with PAS, ATPase and Fis domain